MVPDTPLAVWTDVAIVDSEGDIGIAPPDVLAVPYVSVEGGSDLKADSVDLTIVTTAPEISFALPLPTLTVVVESPTTVEPAQGCRHPSTAGLCASSATKVDQDIATAPINAENSYQDRFEAHRLAANEETLGAWQSDALDSQPHVLVAELVVSSEENIQATSNNPPHKSPGAVTAELRVAPQKEVAQIASFNPGRNQTNHTTTMLGIPENSSLASISRPYHEPPTLSVKSQECSTEDACVTSVDLRPDTSDPWSRSLWVDEFEDDDIAFEEQDEEGQEEEGNEKENEESRTQSTNALASSINLHSREPFVSSTLGMTLDDSEIHSPSDKPLSSTVLPMTTEATSTTDLSIDGAYPFVDELRVTPGVDVRITSFDPDNCLSPPATPTPAAPPLSPHKRPRSPASATTVRTSSVTRV